MSVTICSNYFSDTLCNYQQVSSAISEYNITKPKEPIKYKQKNQTPSLKDCLKQIIDHWSKT